MNLKQLVLYTCTPLIFANLAPAQDLSFGISVPEEYYNLPQAKLESIFASQGEDAGRCQKAYNDSRTLGLNVAKTLGPSCDELLLPLQEGADNEWTLPDITAKPGQDLLSFCGRLGYTSGFEKAILETASQCATSFDREVRNALQQEYNRCYKSIATQVILEDAQVAKSSNILADESFIIPANSRAWESFKDSLTKAPDSPLLQSACKVAISHAERQKPPVSFLSANPGQIKAPWDITKGAYFGASIGNHEGVRVNLSGPESRDPVIKVSRSGFSGSTEHTYNMATEVIRVKSSPAGGTVTEETMDPEHPLYIETLVVIKNAMLYIVLPERYFWPLPDAESTANFGLVPSIAVIDKALQKQGYQNRDCTLYQSYDQLALGSKSFFSGAYGELGEWSTRAQAIFMRKGVKGIFFQGKNFDKAGAAPVTVTASEWAQGNPRQFGDGYIIDLAALGIGGKFQSFICQPGR